MPPFPYFWTVDHSLGLFSGVLLCVGTFMAFRAKSKKRVKRRLSFTSQIMAAGAWPNGFDMAEPIINAVLTFENLPSLSNIKSVIRQVMAYDRMGGACTRDSSGAWGFDPRTAPPTAGEVEKHLTVMEVAGEAALWAKAHEVCMCGLHALDKAKDPWWEFVLLKNTRSKTHAVIVRVHHTVGDGIALVGLVRAIMTDRHGKPIPDYFTVASERARAAANAGNGGGGLFGALGFGLKVASAAVHCLTLGMSRYDSPLMFTAKDKKALKYSGKRRTLLLPDIDLAFIKALKDKATAKDGVRTTINDILFAATTGAIRRYCQARDDPLLPPNDPAGNTPAADLQLRALLPVSFPRKASITDTARALRNLWCMVSCPMPVGSGGVLGRLENTRKITSQIKPPKSFVPLVQLWIQNHLLPKLPMFLSRQTCYDTFTRHSCIFTNVPGPPTPILWAGSEVKAMQMIFPNLISQISMLSYGDVIHGNIVVDDHVVTNPELFRSLFVEELKEVADVLKVPFVTAIENRAKELAALKV